MPRKHRESPTREAIFLAICEFKEMHDGNSPPLEWLAQQVYLNRSTVMYHLIQLEREGRLSWNIHQRRAIEIAGAVWLPPTHPIARQLHASPLTPRKT